MPQYLYKCEKCDFEGLITHKMSETIDTCIKCKGPLKKQLSNFTFTPIGKKEEKKVGEYTKKYIEEVKEKVEQQKRELKKQSLS